MHLLPIIVILRQPLNNKQFHLFLELQIPFFLWIFEQ